MKFGPRKFGIMKFSIGKFDIMKFGIVRTVLSNVFARYTHFRESGKARKYRLDIIAVFVLVPVVPLMVVRAPDVKYGLVASGTEDWDKKKRLDLIMKSGAGDYTQLSAKNVFAPDGKYPEEKLGKESKPKKSYTLLGVLLENNRRAVLIDENHAVHIVKDGDAVEDAGRLFITGPTSIVFKGDDGEKELKIFSVKR